MKRLGNLYSKIFSLENLSSAQLKARRGKSRQYDVKNFDKKSEENLVLLNQILSNKVYKTSQYSTFYIYEPKERLISKLPYFPDRITHHAIMNVLEPIFVSVFIKNTYSCIKGRGIHLALSDLKLALKDEVNTKYCLKLDIKKFYPNINHDVLKSLLEHKFKDRDLLNLLFEIIDSSEGLPIGSYLSQFLANFYLTYFDHWLKEVKQVKYYFRYADDIVILSDNKQKLHELFKDINNYLLENLKLEVKNNYQIFPVSSRGIDFLGYKTYHTHCLVRKKIKKNFAKMLAKRYNYKSINSYNGWLKHCNSKNLKRKLIK